MRQIPFALPGCKVGELPSGTAVPLTLHPTLRMHSSPSCLSMVDAGASFPLQNHFILKRVSLAPVTERELRPGEGASCLCERCPSMGLAVKPRPARSSCCCPASPDLETGLGGRLRLPPGACDDASSAHGCWLVELLRACFPICKHGGRVSQWL